MKKHIIIHPPFTSPLDFIKKQIALIWVNMLFFNKAYNAWIGRGVMDIASYMDNKMDHKEVVYTCTLATVCASCLLLNET